jgi:hypothetical protein
MGLRHEKMVLRHRKMSLRHTRSEEIPIALKTCFDYDAGISHFMRAEYPYTEWISLLKTEIKAGRPVYYTGQDSEDDGHAFVCDGYDINNLFHFNWGWGGSSDGYFEVSALTGGYNQSQTIITGIQPSDGQTTIQLELPLFYANKTSLSSLAESFSVIADTLKNTGSVNVSNPNLGVLLCRQDDSRISHQTSLKRMNMRPYDYFTAFTFLSDYSLPTDLPAGKYKLYSHSC